MKSYYYVNATHGDNIRIDGDNNLIVSLQGKHFKSVRIHSASIIADSLIDGLALRLNTYSGNGFSSNRLGVLACIFEGNVFSATDYRYYISTPAPEYYISETLNELSFSIIDGIDTTIQPVVANFESILILLE